LNQSGKVRLFKADTRRRDAVMLDLRRNVLVVWIGPGKLRNMRMFKRVILGDFFAGLIDFVAIAADAASCKVNKFPDSRVTSPANVTWPSSLARVEPMVTSTKVEC
jgi:hypothetical protein